MPRNKPRLLLALYSRPKHPDSYHYSLLLTPKLTKNQTNFSATKYHALNTLQNVSGVLSSPWRYECSIIANVSNEHRLLVCVIIAKVIDQAALESILAAVPIYQIDDSDMEKAAAFDCVAWVREALARLQYSTAVTSLAAFEQVEQCAFQYLAKKKDEGRWEGHPRPGVPVFDLLQGRELVA